MNSLKIHIAPFHWLPLLVAMAWFVLTPLKSSAQTAAVPDTVFRNFLKKMNPSLIDANGRLVISEAAKVGGTVNGSNLNITSIEGIQYFVNARVLSFVSASLTSLPSQVANMTNLQGINVMYNQLESLPDVSKMKRLKNLNVHYNNLQRLPNLSQNDSLVELKVNNNRLDSLPDVSNLVRLVRFTIHGNRISKINGLDKLVALEEFWCNSNLLGNFPDLSNLKKLWYFDASNNQLTVAPSFGPRSPLKTLLLQNNRISTLSDYSTYDSLAKVNLTNNSLTFKELLTLTSKSNYASIFQLSPQRTLPMPAQLLWTEGNPYTLSTHVDKEVKDVHYNWYKNNLLDTTVTGDSWRLHYAQLTDSGHYSCKLTHPAFANFFLETEVFAVSLLSCIDLNAVSTAATEINCMKTGTLDVTLSPTGTNLTYILESPKSGKSFISNTGRFQGLTEPAYTLSIQTATGCNKIYPKEIKIPYLKCKDYLITPDNDGNADTFYFEASGKAEIYDKRGNMIRRINIPAEWDCFSEKGKVPSGYYIANINDGESQIGLSVVY